MSTRPVKRPEAVVAAIAKSFIASYYLYRYFDKVYNFPLPYKDFYGAPSMVEPNCMFGTTVITSTSASIAPSSSNGQFDYVSHIINSWYALRYLD